MQNNSLEYKHKLTRNEKEANNKQWFKHNVDMSENIVNTIFSTSDGNKVSDFKRMKVNYDLFNNKINKKDFEHVCYPFGKNVGELPADFSNKDIVSSKIKALIGMEMKRPFAWKSVAVNEEATTRKEQKRFGMYRDFVINSIMQPIKADIEKQYAQTLNNKELTKDERDKIENEIAEQLRVKTPPEIEKYIVREHQDPAEVLMQQLLQFLFLKQDISVKFNKGWKHGLISGKIIFWVGIINGEPVLKVINPIRFDFDKNIDNEFIEDGDWATYEMYMTPSEISRYFGDEFSDIELEEICENNNNYHDNMFSFVDSELDNITTSKSIRVLHREWKALKPIKFVHGININTGEEYMDIVDESYVINREVGDIDISTIWIPRKYEGYKVGTNKYAYLREVPGQTTDLDNLYDCKLSYIGSTFDNLNSETTSLIDRMKYYQYLYNVLLYRIELLMASDDGKTLLLNANLIPKSSGLDIEKWMYYLKVNKIGLMDPSEEGNKGNSDITQAAKEIDMSLISDIQKYIQLAEYIEKRCGESVGITRQVEGQFAPDEAVRNAQQSLVQTSNILEPYFELHNSIKRNVLQALVECAKKAYSTSKKNKLSYILDDMSMQMIDIDTDLLDNSTYGIFVNNSLKANKVLENIQQLAHAAMQNQMLEMSDLIVILNAESTQEAGEQLKVAENQRIQREQAQAQSQFKQQAESEENARQFRREEWSHEREMLILSEQLKTDRELKKQTIMSMGFNTDKDMDKDGTPDILEVYKATNDTEFKNSKLDLERDKLEQQKKEHTDKIEIENKKLKVKPKTNK